MVMTCTRTFSDGDYLTLQFDLLACLFLGFGGSVAHERVLDKRFEELARGGYLTRCFSFSSLSRSLARWFDGLHYMSMAGNFWNSFDISCNIVTL